MSKIEGGYRRPLKSRRDLKQSDSQFPRSKGIARVGRQ